MLVILQIISTNVGLGRTLVFPLIRIWKFFPLTSLFQRMNSMDPSGVEEYSEPSAERKKSMRRLRRAGEQRSDREVFLGVHRRGSQCDRGAAVGSSNSLVSSSWVLPLLGSIIATFLCAVLCIFPF